MSEFDTLISSDEFRVKPVEEQLQVVNDYWDKAAAMNPESPNEIELRRRISTGGIEAWSRVNGASVDGGIYKEEARKEAEAYEMANALIKEGIHRKDPDRFNSIVARIEGARHETQMRMSEDLNELQSAAISSAEDITQLYNGLEKNGMLRGVLTSFGTSVGSKGIERGDNGWIAPLVTASEDGELGALAKTQEYLSQQMGQTRDADSFFTREQERALPKFLNDFQAKTGWSDQQMQTAWSDLGNQNRQWKDDTEKFRIMSWGEIIPNPSSSEILDTEKVREEVMASTAPAIAKTNFLKNLAAYQTRAAQELAPALAATSVITPGGEDFEVTLTRELAEGKSTTDIVRDYTKRNGLSEPQRLYMNFVIRGGTKINQQFVGLGDLVRGESSQIGRDLAEAEQLWAEGYSGVGGSRGKIASLADGVFKEVPSIGVQVLLTRGVGAGAGGAASAVGLGTRGVATATRWGATTAALTGAGIQSTTLTYSNSIKEAYDAGMDLDEAHDIARSKALKAGVSTAIITGMFQKIGFGGVEQTAVNTTMRGLSAEAAKRGVSLTTASKGFFSKMFNSPTGRAMIGEGAEEGLDEFVQAFVTADPDEPIYNAWENALEAAKIGAAIGGLASGFERWSSRRADKAAGVGLTGDREAGGARTLTEEEIAGAAEGTAVPATEQGNIFGAWTDGDNTLVVREGADGNFRAVELKDGKESVVEFPTSSGKPVSNASRAHVEKQLAKDGYRQAFGIKRDEGGEIVTNQDTGKPQIVLIDSKQGERQRQQILDEIKREEQRRAKVRKDIDRRAAERVRGQTQTTIDADKREATLKAVDREVASIRNREVVDENKRTAAEQEAFEQMERIRRLQPGLQRTGSGLQIELAGNDSVISPEKYEATKEEREAMDGEQRAKVDAEVAAAKALNDSGINTVRDLYQILSDPRIATAPGETANSIRLSAEVILSTGKTNAPGVVVNTNAGETGPPPVTATRDNPSGPQIQPGAVPIQQSGTPAPGVEAPRTEDPAEAPATPIEDAIDEMLDDTPFEAAVRAAVDEVKAEAKVRQHVRVVWDEKTGDARVELVELGKGGPGSGRVVGFKTVLKAEYEAGPKADEDIEEDTEEEEQAAFPKGTKARIDLGNGVETVRRKADGTWVVDEQDGGEYTTALKDADVRARAVSVEVGAATPPPLAKGKQNEAAILDEINNRNNGNIEAAKKGNGYGKSGIPGKFIRSVTSVEDAEKVIDGLEEWIGKKEDALTNYSGKSSVDPNQESAREDEIALADELLDQHKASLADLQKAKEEAAKKPAINPEDEVEGAKPPDEKTDFEEQKEVASEIGDILDEETGSRELMISVMGSVNMKKIKSALQRIAALLLKTGRSHYGMAISSAFDPTRVLTFLKESEPHSTEVEYYEEAKAEVAAVRKRIREKLDAAIEEGKTDEWTKEIIDRVEKHVGKRLTSNSHTAQNLIDMYHLGVANLEREAADLREANAKVNRWNPDKSKKRNVERAQEVFNFWTDEMQPNRAAIEEAEAARRKEKVPQETPTPPTETDESKAAKRLDAIKKIAKRTEPTPEKKDAAIADAKKKAEGRMPSPEEFNEIVNSAIDAGLISQEAAVRISQIETFEDQLKAFEDRMEIAEANRATEKETGRNPEDTRRDSREEEEELRDLTERLEDEAYEAWMIEGVITEEEYGHIFSMISEVATRADYERLNNELQQKRQGDAISSDLDYTNDGNVEQQDDDDYFYRSDADRNKVGTDAKRAAARKQLGNLIAVLSDRFGIEFVWESGMDSNTRGYFSRSRGPNGERVNKIHLNKDILMDSETPLHEVGHAFMAALRSWNPELHQSLVDEFTDASESDPYLQGIIDEAVRLYAGDKSTSTVLDEAMVRYLGRAAAKRLNENGEVESADISNDRSKTWIGRFWNAVTKMLRSIFKSSPGRTRVADLSNDSTLSDIIDMMVDPDRAFDLQLGADVEQNMVQQLREMGQAIRVTTSSIRRTITDSGRKVSMAVVLKGKIPHIQMFFGDMNEAAKNLGDTLAALRESISIELQRQMLTELGELGSLIEDKVNERFWRGREEARQRIVNTLGYSENMSKEDILFVLRDVLQPSLEKKIADGDIESASVMSEILRVSNDIALKPKQFVAPVSATLPGASGSAISTSTLGEWAAGALDLIPGRVTTLNEEQLLQLEEALHGRELIGDAIHKVGRDPNITQEQANRWLTSVFASEAQTFHSMMPDLERGQMMGGDVDYVKFIKEGIRGVDLSLAHRGTLNQQSRSGPATAFGTGTVESLYNATPTGPSHASPTGFGRIAMKKDGQPHAPFSDIGKAAAFRVTVAAREGLKASELKIVKAEKGGVVTYHVVVPDPIGRAEVARVGIVNEVIGDPGTMPNLPTIEDNRKYLSNSGLNFIKLARRMTSKMKKFLPEMDFLKSAHTTLDKVGDSLNVVIQNAMLQRTWARNVAAAKHSYLESRFKGALAVNEEVGSPDYGKATNIAIPAGKSPYLADILTESMVDETAYPLSPEQLEAVREMRSMMEQMRNLMRRAKIDKKWLNEQGLDAADFLADPSRAGDESWRRYFPRMVAGYLDNRGQFQPKRYIGSGSPNTEQKGFDQKRITDDDGNVLTMEQIMADPELSKTVYVTNPFESLEHFFNQAYSAMASVDLADNLSPYAKKDGPNKETLRASFIRGVPVLNEVFDNEIAAYLDDKLVKMNDEDPTIAKVQRGAIALKSIALGGADVAAPLTVAAAFTLTQPFKRLFAGDGLKGLADVLEVFGRSSIRIIKRNAASEKRHRAWIAQHSGLMSEIAALGGMLGGGLDYNQQADAIRRINDLKYRTAARHRAIDTIKHSGEGWLQRLSDFHREYSEMGKLLMWDVAREKYLAPDGKLRTDPDSVAAMMEEVRDIDRAMGYSNDLSVSLVSRNMKGVMNIVSTAPTMYVSLLNNLTTMSGVKKTSGVLAAGAAYYIMMGLAAGMKEDEILRRMDPRKKGFFTIDIKIPRSDGTESVLKFSLSNFYKSLAVAVGKTADNSAKLWKGEPVSRSDVYAPIANMGRGRFSPFASAAIGIVTGEDYFGNAINWRQAISQSMIPISLTDTVGAWVDRQNIPGLDLVSPEQEYLMSEKESLKKQLAQTFFAVLGANAYGERESQAIDRERDEVSRERHGVAFEELGLRAAVKIAEEVQERRGSPVKIPTSSSIDAWIRKEKDRYITMFPKKYERFLRQADIQNKAQLRVPMGFKTKDGIRISMKGESKSQHWRAAVNAAIPKLDVLMETAAEHDAHPYGMGEEILSVINEVNRAESDAMKRAAGIK